MKPLDLQVGIQNSYEAARSESVRLEKPHVASMLSNEDAQRDQVMRDQSVLPPESRTLEDDLFSSDEYETPDYRKGEGGNKQRNARQKPPSASDKAVASDEKPGPETESGTGFSTYA